MTTSIVAYSETEAALTSLHEKYAAVIFDVTTAEGMSTAKESYKDVNRYSILLEAARVKEKAESLKYGKFVDSEAKRISDKLDVLRLPIKAQIEVETKRVEREREDAARIVQEKLEADRLAVKLAEEKKLADDRAAIALAHKELADKIELENRASRLRIEEAERAARLEREEADRAARQLREAEEDKLKIDRDKLEAERRIIEDRQRKEREAEEAKQRVLKMELADALDARAMLIEFNDRYSDRPEFREIVLAIKKFLGSE